MAMDVIRSTYRGLWWALMLRGLFAIALGAFILLRPVDSLASFALVIAFLALFTGFVEILRAIEMRRVFNHWWMLLLGGLVSAIFGVAALYYYPGLSLTFAVVWATWWLFLTGGFAVMIAVMQRRLGMGWGWTLAFGLVAFGAGIVAIMNPPATLAAIMGLIAGFALLSGLVLVTGAFRLNALKNQLVQATRPAVSHS